VLLSLIILYQGAVTLGNFLSNLSRNAVAKQVAGPCYTVQSFSAFFNIFDRGKLKTPRTLIISEQNINKFAHAFVKNLAQKLRGKFSTGGVIHCAMALQIAFRKADLNATSCNAVLNVAHRKTSAPKIAQCNSTFININILYLLLTKYALINFIY